ncbi:CPBP family intramembrane glutamic endopeptidase [Geodermatophilus amargosae]|uniref:CPBP family intramembrane glutamic endopeptidase n=1 Tax=Geodermatophilus amargosae TaxID=1296565 RepID=UPI0034DF89BB
MADTQQTPAHPFPMPRARDTSTGVAGLVRRRPLTAFLAWFFTVGQALVFTPSVARGYGVDLPPQVFVVASTLVGLLLPAVVITWVVDGPAGVRDLWRRSSAVWVSVRWYVLALAAVPALSTALAFAVLGAPTAATGAASVGTALVSGLLVQTVVALVPNNWAEEVAWTGFVQSRLQARSTPMRAAALTAPLFALQHVVLVIGDSVAVAVVLMLFFVAVNVPIRAVMGWTYNRTGSLFAVALLHAAANGAGGGSGFGTGFLPRLYPDASLVGVLHLLALAVVGLVVLVATRGRLGASGSSRAPSVVSTVAPVRSS